MIYPIISIERKSIEKNLQNKSSFGVNLFSQPDVKGGFQLLKERYPHCASDWVLVLIAQHVKIIDRSNSGIAETAKYLSIKTTHLAENYAKRVIETTLRGTRIESGVSLFTAVAKEFSKKSWRDVAPKSLIEFHPVIGEQLTINEINKLDPEPYDLREPSGLLRKPQNIRQALYLVDNLFAWNSPVLSFKSWLARESLHVNDRQHLGVFGIIFRARYKGIDLEEHELNEFMRGEIPLSKQGKPVEILTKIAKLMGEEFTSERLLAEANISIGSAASFSPKGPRPRAG